MDKLVGYQQEINKLVGSLEIKNFSETHINILLEKLKIVDAILKDMKNDDLQDTIFFEELVVFAHELGRAERVIDRMEKMKKDLFIKFRKRMHHVLTETEFERWVDKYLTVNSKLQIMEQVETDFIFDKIVDRALMNRKINPKLLALDPEKEYRIDEIEEIDEVEAMKVQKEAFNYILLEEEKLQNYTNDYFFHKARGIKKLKGKEEGFYKIYSITIGCLNSYSPMFKKGESFELDGSVFTAYEVNLENRFPTRNVLMGRLDENSELRLRVRVPVHIQVYICKKESEQ